MTRVLRNFGRLSFGAVPVVALMVALAGAASASPSPRSALVLTLRDAGNQLPPSTAYLSCRPPRGSYADPERVCATLNKVDGDLNALRNPGGVLCTFIFQPVVAEAYGFWGDKTIRYQKTFGNRCLAAAETEAVFQF